MTTITSTDEHVKQLEFALIRLDKRWHELTEAARAVCLEAPADTEAVTRLRALVGMNVVNPSDYPLPGMAKRAA